MPLISWKFSALNQNKFFHCPNNWTISHGQPKINEYYKNTQKSYVKIHFNLLFGIRKKILNVYTWEKKYEMFVLVQQSHGLSLSVRNKQKRENTVMSKTIFVFCSSHFLDSFCCRFCFFFSLVCVHIWFCVIIIWIWNMY